MDRCRWRLRHYYPNEYSNPFSTWNNNHSNNNNQDCRLLFVTADADVVGKDFQVVAPPPGRTVTATVHHLRRTITTTTATLASSSAGNTDGGADDSHPNIPNNAFRILGIPQTFQIDEQDLKQKYRALMNQHHPDRFHQQQQEQQQAKDDNKDDSDDNKLSSPPVQASAITHAYDQLKNPHRRAVHLLEILGKPLLEEDQKGGSSNKNATAAAVDMDFLTQVMEIREQIDQAIGSHDDEKTSSVNNTVDQALKPLWEENHRRMAATCQELQQAFERNDLEEAHRLTGHLQYWNRIDETIREHLSSLS